MLFRFYFILLSFVVLFCSCSKQDSKKCNIDSSLQSISDFPIGVAVDQIYLNNDSMYRHVFMTQFSSATAENTFKPAYLHPEEYSYNWYEAEQLINFCRANNMRVHGHTLIWHQQNPQWMLEYKGNREDWERMMKLHITSIVRYFKPSILSWDVVNEAFNEDGSLRNTIWLEHIGPSYIELAYRTAHEANPDAKLFYNDFGLEMNPTKRKAVINFFNHLKSRGVPIDGIGLQMHVDIKYTEAAMIEDAIRDVANNHYDVHLSEVDISLNPLGKAYQLTTKDLEAQADLMVKIVRAYKNIPKYQQFGITFWGVSDQYSWIPSYYNRTDYPLLFDESFNPKPIYCKLKQAL